MNPRDAFASALDMLRANRMRSFLTVLGVVIGVAIVILLTSMGESARTYVANLVQSVGFGANVLVIHPGKMDPPIEASRLTYQDALEVRRRVPGVVDVMPVMLGTVKARYGQKSRMTNVWGVTPNYPGLIGYRTRQGAFFDEADNHRRKKVCVLGEKVATALFGRLSPVGERIRLGSKKFLIVGVMEQKGEMVGFDIDDVIFLPVTTASDLLDTTRLLEIVAWTSDPDAVGQVKQGIRDVLLSRHKREDDFHFHTQGEVMSVLGKVTSALTTFVAAIAAISLVVGSIGIMNIMLVSVAERTREIGIRKAIGARRKDIFVQFLTEALLISFLGGLMGIAFGAGLSVAVLSLINLPVRVTGWAVVAAVIASGIVGIVSGVYPAMRAASLDPVHALRYE
ncbi:MAG: FtsX-like permease family protein [Armatimonadetes bacterium]|nr:FtsX-like permease family protein [Armatimonadota bacterium]